MSPTGCLELERQADLDVIIRINGEGMNGEKESAQVEFCVSGGQSPHTTKALWLLMEAMKKDNGENPQ